MSTSTRRTFQQLLQQRRWRSARWRFSCRRPFKARIKTCSRDLQTSEIIVSKHWSSKVKIRRPSKALILVSCSLTTIINDKRRNDRRRRALIEAQASRIQPPLSSSQMRNSSNRRSGNRSRTSAQVCCKVGNFSRQIVTLVSPNRLSKSTRSRSIRFSSRRMQQSSEIRRITSTRNHRARFA